MLLHVLYLNYVPVIANNTTKIYTDIIKLCDSLSIFALLLVFPAVSPLFFTFITLTTLGTGENTLVFEKDDGELGL